jgi:hypothetical protein
MVGGLQPHGALASGTGRVASVRVEERRLTTHEMRGRTVRELREQERSGSIRFDRFLVESTSIYKVYSLVRMAPLLPCATKQVKE